MKVYETPNMEVVSFESEAIMTLDVIQASIPDSSVPFPLMDN